MTPRFPFLAFAVCLAIGALPGQSGSEPAAEPPAKKVNKLEAWPELSKADSDSLLACLGQFRKDGAELHAAARERLIAIGAAGAPLLLQKVTDRADSINEHLFAVFDATLDARHAALMARETKKKGVELRRYLFRRLARFNDPDLLPVFAANLADKDPEIAFYAALGALALGEAKALPIVLEYTKSNWENVGEEVALSLTPARSRLHGNIVFEAIAKASASDRMAGLRLARYLAVKEHNVILRGYLQANEHAVKKEAVNALRVMNGEGPLETLTVFQVIGMAKEWLAKI